MQNGCEVYETAYCAGWQPEPLLTVSAWADKHRVMGNRAGRAAVRWRTAITPYLREIMDALGPRSPARRVVFMKGSQVGGPLALDTPIPTPESSTTMGEVCVGDRVFDEGGHVCSVTYVSPAMIGNACFEVRFSDGAAIVTDGGHRWAVDDDIRGSDRSARRILSTEEIAGTFRHGGNRHRYAIPVTRPFDLPERDLPIDPYALGVWLGDGSASSNQITEFEDDAMEIGRRIAAGGHLVVVRRPAWVKGRCVNLIIEPTLPSRTCRRGHDLDQVGVYRFMKRGKPAQRCAECGRQASMASQYGRPRDPVVRAPTFYSHLKALGLINNKRIPQCYLRASSDQRMDLLRGLMDTDGSITKDGRCEFSSSKPELVEDVLDLMRGLGLKPTVRIRAGHGFSDRTRTGNQHFALGFQAYDDWPVFALKRKRDRLRSRASGRPSETERRRIVDVRPVPTVPVRCIAVDSPSHLYLAGAGMIATHNTEAGNNWLGFVMHHTPGPILVLRPTVDEARRFSRQRIDPMIATTPVLSGLVKESRSRDGGNSMLIKEFPGGILFLTGSNSATGVKSMPIRCLFCDEVDEYPGDVDGQGDPIALAEKRTTGPTYSRRKVFLVSTPTIKGLSRIEREFLASDQRRYFVPCPECGAFDWIRWENIRWNEGDPKSAALACVACGSLIEERFKTQMLARGEWRPTAPGDGTTIGFHLSSLYSPLGWLPWSAAVAEFIAAKENPMMLKNWINSVLGETWEERGETVEPEGLLARAERYAADVPKGVGVLVASVDVQGDRLECAVKGYGAGEESWLIAFSQFHGDPGREQVWLDLDRFLRQEFTHESGQHVPITCVAVDSGGHHSEQVYRFCRARLERRVFAVRGGAEHGKPVVGRPSDNNRYHAKLFTLCVDTAKETIYSRLRIGSPGPGYCHFPEWTDAEYVAQLTAEKAIRKWVKNRGTVREWIKIRERNEALDLEVYCLAALYILGPTLVRSLPERAAALARPADAPAEKEAAAAAPPRGRGGWVTGWRG